MEFFQPAVGGSPAEAPSAAPAQWLEAPSGKPAVLPTLVQPKLLPSPVRPSSDGEDISLVQAQAQPSTEAVSALPTIAETAPSLGPMSWKDPRFPPAIEAVRLRGMLLSLPQAVHK